MNLKLYSVLFIFSLSVVGCENSSIKYRTPQYSISLVGKWRGNIGEMQMEIEFEEVPFEGAIFLIGDATLTINGQSTDYRVMNGSRGEKELFFALYEKPVVTKEEFHVDGTIKSEMKLQGTYKQFEVGPFSPQVIKTGSWILNKVD